MCSIEVGVCAQDMLTIIDIIDLCDHIMMSTSIFTLIKIEIFIQAQQIMRRMAVDVVRFVKYLALITCFISNKMWVQRGNLSE